ncbi:MAG TPA: OB-fold domain-containing protein [Caulobacteraceae bacterium]
MAEARRIPAPAVNVEGQPFWDAAAQGRFLIKRCGACGEPHWYPRAICPFCFSEDTAWEESAGEGVIYTFSVMRRNTPAPYAIGYVTLDEGVSLLTNFVDCDLDGLTIGQRVKLKWTPTEGGPPVFTFTPA